MSELLDRLVKTYAETDIEFPHLKEITLAQWMLESGRGTSRLATDHLNFGGLKWREEMQGFATPVEYDAHDGRENYCKFDNLEQFIRGYWRFIERSPYQGWRDHINPAEEFIEFIGPIYAGDRNYVSKVLNLHSEAKQLFASVGHEEHHHTGTSEPVTKPLIKQFVESPNYSSRDGGKITNIVVHYTTAGNVQSTINHFLNPASQVSAHYIIDKNGDIYQMVKDADKAWHAAHANRHSIGIEHVAKVGEKLTDLQEKSSIHLIRWLMTEYKVSKENIQAHKQILSTSCPGNIFGDSLNDTNLLKFKEWVNRNFFSLVDSNRHDNGNGFTGSHLGSYTVQPGDTLSEIAQRFSMTLQQLLDLNSDIPNPNIIVPGQIIKITQDGLRSGASRIYVVQSGDTLSEIAQRFGTTLQQLRNLNPGITDPNRIFPGQQIIVSGEGGNIATGTSRSLNLSITIAEHQLDPSIYQRFSHPILGSITVTGGFMEPHGHSLKPAMKAIFLDGSLRDLPPSRRNIGIDYVVSDSKVKAWVGGTVIRAGREGGYGRRIHIQLNATYEFQGRRYQVYQAYAHNQSILVSVGQNIEQGQQIAVMGGSGSSSDNDYPPHVDFDTYFNLDGTWVHLNPQALDRRLAATLVPVMA